VIDSRRKKHSMNLIIIPPAAMEIGIEPTVRHGADLGYIPIVVTDACGSGDSEVRTTGEKSIAQCMSQHS
jgi:nicotinamidase-related amidase